MALKYYMWWKTDNAGVADRFREQLRKTSVHKKMCTGREEEILHVKNVSSPRGEEEKFPDLLVLHFNFSLRENCRSFEMLKEKQQTLSLVGCWKIPVCQELHAWDCFCQALKLAPLGARLVCRWCHVNIGQTQPLMFA